MKVLQFICSTGFYGAERWVLALSKHLPDSVSSELVVTLEPGTEELELVKQFKATDPIKQEEALEQYQVDFAGLEAFISNQA